MIHLDTSVVVAYLRGDQNVATRLAEAIPDVAIGSIVLAELFFGARRSARTLENFARIQDFTRLVPPLSFDEACAAKYGEIRAHLATIGKPSGEVDTFIGAMALAHSARLVTKNRRHFENMPGLELDDWTA